VKDDVARAEAVLDLQQRQRHARPCGSGRPTVRQGTHLTHPTARTALGAANDKHTGKARLWPVYARLSVRARACASSNASAHDECACVRTCPCVRVCSCVRACVRVGEWAPARVRVCVGATPTSCSRIAARFVMFPLARISTCDDGSSSASESDAAPPPLQHAAVASYISATRWHNVQHARCTVQHAADNLRPQCNSDRAAHTFLHRGTSGACVRVRTLCARMCMRKLACTCVRVGGKGGMGGEGCARYPSM
jgi:hypothetical protein